MNTVLFTKSLCSLCHFLTAVRKLLILQVKCEIGKEFHIFPPSVDFNAYLNELHHAEFSKANFVMLIL